MIEHTEVETIRRPVPARRVLVVVLLVGVLDRMVS